MKNCEVSRRHFGQAAAATTAARALGSSVSDAAESESPQLLAGAAEGAADLPA